MGLFLWDKKERYLEEEPDKPVRKCAWEPRDQEMSVMDEMNDMGCLSDNWVDNERAKG